MDTEEAAGLESDSVVERLRHQRTLPRATRTGGGSGDGGGTTIAASASSTVTDYSFTDAFSPTSIAAGYIAGICGVLVGHPLDSIKVLLQLQSLGPNHVATTTLAPKPCILSWRQLYAGVQGPLLTVGLIQALNFGVYDACRQWLHVRRQSRDSRVSRPIRSYHANKAELGEVAVASFLAGSVISAPTAVLQAIKIQQQQNPSLTLRRTMLSQRWPHLWKGMKPHFFCEAVGRMVYLTSYECFKQQVIALKNASDISESTLSLPERLLCAGMSGICCWTFIFPADVLRSRMYATQTREKTSTIKMAVSIYQKEGWRPFYRGLSVTAARAFPVSAAVLPVFDITHKWLQKSITCN